MENKRQLWELQQMQSLPLNLKVRLTQSRVRDWVHKYGEDGVYVSFSGGKDSTVLLDIVRKIFPSVKAVFVDVPTQYPELRDFVKTYDNVEIIKPKTNFMQMCEKYGFPIISKEVSESVAGARKYLTKILEENSLDRQTDRQTPYAYKYRQLMGIGEYSKFSNAPSEADKQAMLDFTRGGTIINGENYEELANILNQRMKNRQGGSNQRLAIMLGWLTKDKENPIKANIPEKDRSNYSQEKYKFLLNAPFEISNQCCNVMKKAPLHDYTKRTGQYGITAEMASESRLRTQKWLQNGCNGFDLRIPKSTPMAFWTEQDILLYIKENNLPICSVYGDVVIDWQSQGQCENQISFADMGLFDDKPLLKTSGCSRTGCMLCGFGCHMEKEEDSRFLMLKETHPKMYALLDVVKNNGVTFREALEWINKNGNMNIKF